MDVASPLPALAPRDLPIGLEPFFLGCRLLPFGLVLALALQLALQLVSGPDAFLLFGRLST